MKIYAVHYISARIMRTQCNNKLWFLPAAACSGIVIIFILCIAILQILKYPAHDAQQLVLKRFETSGIRFAAEVTPEDDQRQLNIDRSSAIDKKDLVSELDAIDSAARSEIDQYESVRSVELTRKQRQAHLIAPDLPVEGEAAMVVRGFALMCGASSQNWNVSPNYDDSAYIILKLDTVADICSAAGAESPAVLLSYYSIRNGYVRRDVPDTTNNTAQLTNSIRSHFYNVRFNAFNSAHSHDFHTDNLKFQHTITTGVIHRAVELCPFENRRV